MHRFVITIGEVAPTAVDEYLRSSDPVELSYSPDGHFAWRSRNGHVQVAGWWTDEPDHDTPTDGSLTAWGGNIRIAGSPGRPQAAALRAAVHHDHREPRSQLRDAWALVDVDADGTGIAVGDELGNHPLFVAEPTDGVMILGNRPALVAETLGRWRGRATTRSIEAAAWMAFAGYVVGDHTGFDGVTALPQGAYVRIDRGRADVITPPPVYAGEADDRIDLASFTDALEAEIVDGLRHALALGDRPQLELTAGKDTRLVFAAAVSAGLVDQFAITTIGPPDLLDVEVAAALCEIVGVHHHRIDSRKPVDAPTYSSLTRARRHVHRTGGVSQVGDAVEPTFASPFYVSGMYGEYYRVTHAGEARNPATSLADATERFLDQRRFGTAGLVRADVAARLEGEAIAHIAAAGDIVRDPADLRAAFTTRFRFPAWQAPLIDRKMRAVLPLANGAMVRDVYRLPPEDRCLELPHRIIIERADRRLYEHPLGNTAWRTPKRRRRPAAPKPVRPPAPPGPPPLPPTVDRVRRLVPRRLRQLTHPLWRRIQHRRTPAPPPPPPTPPPEPAPKPTVEIEPTPAQAGVSTVRQLRDWLPINRRDLLALMDDDVDNALFTIVDRNALLAHIASLDADDPLAAMQVNGAISSFLWLGGHELPSRTEG